MATEFQREPSLQPNMTNIIRVSMPASSLYDLDRFQKVQKEILGRLGCGGCTSGHDIRWDFSRNFLVDEKAQIHEIGSFAR